MKFVIALNYRNWVAGRAEIHFALARMVLQPAVYLFVFGRVVGGHLSLESGDYSLIMAPGMIAIAVVTAPFVTVGHYINAGFYFRVIEGWLLAPISLRTLLSAMLLSGVLSGMINSSLVALLVWIILGLAPQNYFILLAMAVAGSLLFSLVVLLVLLLPARPSRGQEIFSFLMMPMTFFGCTFYSYNMLSPPLSHLALFIPTTYISEGLRTAYAPEGSHMAIGFILLGLCGTAAVLLPAVDWAFRRRLGHFTW